MTDMTTNEALATVVENLPADAQRVLVDDVRAVLCDAPLVRPRTPNGLDMRVRVSAAGLLGWVGDSAYRYDAAQRDGRAWPTMPTRWAEIANRVAGPHPWDSAIINWYDADASLGWHRDQAEHDTSLPIVTISLGDSCTWAVRAHHEALVSRCRLESGAVTLLAGPTRDFLHTVERIIPNPLFSPLRTRGRISVTIRVAGRPA
jgi:alkylated DNA repair protein (DNA oxidative demethylase)